MYNSTFVLYHYSGILRTYFCEKTNSCPFFHFNDLSMFLNIMFHTPMGRFQLDQNFELLLFSVVNVVPFNCVFFPVGLSFLLHLLQVLLGVEVSTVARPGRPSVETSTPNKTYRRCNKKERPTGKNTIINWEEGEK